VDQPVGATASNGPGWSRAEGGQGSGSDADERARLWAEVTSIAPGYLKYQQRTEREIPLMILEPMGGA
jgi:hypothetical protein